MAHMLAGKNLALLVGRAGQVIGGGGWDIVYCSRHMSEFNLYRRGGNNLCPLYVWPKDEEREALLHEHWPEGKDGRRPNLKPPFVDDFSGKLGLHFASDGPGDLQKTFGPEDIFHYMYAVFHSPTYRRRYAEFLKIDFPRLPLTSDKKLFRTLCGLGAELVALHLLESPKLGDNVPAFPLEGGCVVEKGFPKYDERHARVRTNNDQYFEPISPEVWGFHVGGYQVCEKWLKDRRGRTLSYDDITHYQRIVVALRETVALMAQIDKAIPSWPIE